MTKNEQTDVLRNQLKEILLERMPEPGLFSTALEELTTFRKNEKDLNCNNCFYQPLVSIPVQGAKRSIIGSDEYRYGEGQCLVASVDIPVTSHITAASAKKPYLAITLGLDKYVINQLISELPDVYAAEVSTNRSTEVIDADPGILNAFIRLAEICDDEHQIPILAPLIIREIHYRLLVGPVGHILQMINTAGTPSNQVSSAIAWLRDNYREPLQVDKLAERFGMSISNFHRRFKQVTTLSPVQYQKRLRLHEAQRLMLTEDVNAYHAALSVGYESPTQFNREYKRLFGEPPRRDVHRLAQTSWQSD